MTNPYSTERQQAISALDDLYAQFVSVEASLDELPYNLVWKRSGGRQYLYELLDREGNGRSLGNRTPETEEKHAVYTATKTKLRQSRKELSTRLRDTCRMHRALGLPVLLPQVTKILRSLNEAKLLGSHLLVGGTTALAVYSNILQAPVVLPLWETGPIELYIARELSDNQQRQLEAILNGHQASNIQISQPKAKNSEALTALVSQKPMTGIVAGSDMSPVKVIAPNATLFALYQEDLTFSKGGSVSFAPLLDVLATQIPHPLESTLDGDLPQGFRSVLARWANLSRTNGSPGRGPPLQAANTSSTPTSGRAATTRNGNRSNG